MRSGSKSVRKIIFAAGAALVAALNIAAWNSAAFCDWYISYIFPVWVNTYGRFTGLFPFSVGEWMLIAGALLLAGAALFLLPWLVAELIRKVKNRDAVSGLIHFFRRYYTFFAWTLLAVCLVMTLNCFILYHAHTFSQRYFESKSDISDQEPKQQLEELIRVYNMVAQNSINLSERMDRDENGRVVYSGSVGKNGERLDMADKARQAMKELGKTYGQLDGYYPRPKALYFSDFMCQQYMCGYYFPFSMEANYNDVMYILNIPSTMCHELAHLRGFIYEDEANFIAYLACVSSDDVFFQYAGYLSVLTYLYNDLYRACQTAPQTFAMAAEAVQPVSVTDKVWEDSVFVTQEEWDRINSHALLDTEFVDKAADIFIDTNLKVNGISDGSVSYSRVVSLLLEYYR